MNEKEEGVAARVSDTLFDFSINHGTCAITFSQIHYLSPKFGIFPNKKSYGNGTEII